jgi:HlyD family secretion protein
MRAPRSGRVLALPQESERVVQAGTPLIEIGDPRDLEIVADLLSPDAVQVRPGAPVRIDGWGGPPLRGRVARVDPAGFMKVSALGIEEQRVKTVIDITDPPETWSALGHDFRVVVHIATWNTDKALVVPVGALFRAREQWTVFVVTDGRARLRPVETVIATAGRQRCSRACRRAMTSCCTPATVSGTALRLRRVRAGDPSGLFSAASRRNPLGGTAPFILA